MSKHVITFDASSRQEVLSLLDLDVDEQGYIVEKAEPSNRVIAQSNGEQIQAQDLGAIKKGSIQIFGRDLPSLIDLADCVK